MRKTYIIIAILLSGCDSGSIRNGATLTPETVRAYMSNSCSVPPGPKSYSAYDFYVAGIGAARLQCDNYMLALINANRDSRFASSSIATASSQTALILAATASNATKPIAVIAAASEFVRQIISGYSNEYAFASFAQEIYPQLHTIMNAYLADSRTIQVVSRIKADPYSTASYCIATDIVRTFASNCSPVNIDSNVRAAISSAKPSETSPGVTGKDTPQEDTQQRSLRLPHRPSSSGASQSLALPTYTLGR
jgi:hypothetical protein